MLGEILFRRYETSRPFPSLVVVADAIAGSLIVMKFDEILCAAQTVVGFGESRMQG